MKKTSKILMFLAIAALLMSMLVVLTGCGEKVAGKYELIEMSSKSETFGKDQIEELKNLGFTYTLELREDGTGVMTIAGENTEFKYDDKNIIVEGVSTPYTFENNKLTVSENDEKMVFEKK